MTETPRAAKEPGNGLTAVDLARRAGVDAPFVQRLVELGILAPLPNGFTDGDIRRARILHALDDARFPLEALAEAIKRREIDFREPGPGVIAALEMVEGAREAHLPPAHVGLHAGPVLFQEGDYFGRTVNVAARIADYARQGGVLVSDEVVAASKVPGVRYEPIGPVELKGLTEAVSLHVARRST